MNNATAPQSLRTLLPASSTRDSPTDEVPSQLARRSEAKISTACLTCKKKRTKCSGGPPPCQLCKELKSECIFDVSLDQRRKIASHRRDDDFKSQTRMMEGLFELIRSGGERNVQDLLALIRSNAPVEEVAALIEDGLETAHVGQKRKLSVSDSGSSVKDTGTNSRYSVESSAGPSEAVSYPTTDSLELAQSDRRSWHHSLQVNSAQISNMDVEQWQGSEDSYRAPRKAGKLAAHHTANSSNSRSRDDDDTSTSAEMADIMEGLERAISPGLRSNSTRGHASQPRRTPYASPGYVEVFGNLPMSSAVMTNGYPREVQVQQLCSFRLPIHLIQSMITSDNSALARVYTDYRDSARRLLANGLLDPEPEFTAVDLFFRDRRSSDPHTASFWASELCKTFGDFPVEMQLAGLYLLTYLMRWTVDPSAETYAAMPQMIRPTPSQRLVPHIAAIDLCALPPVRDALTNKLRDFVSTMLRAGVSCNWPHSLDDIVEIDASTGQRKLTALFEQHASNPDNWTIGKIFFESFPEMIGRLNVRENDASTKN